MTAEKRHDERLAMRTRMDYRNEGGGDFLYEFTQNISEGGIFIETHQPLPVGTTVEMRFQPPGSDNPFEVKGNVVWINPVRDGDDNPNPGMGIQFTELSDEEREMVAQVVKAIAYL